MAGSPSDRVLRQVHRLFNIGAVGTMSDAELLDQFVSRRDEAAEAAFEELVIRHGPMVLRVCKRLLHDADDAEDAFQAVFLVLANRAGSIRRNGSVASWLFGVAHRVVIRARRSAARRRALNQRVAGRTSESYLPPENDLDWEILHEEIHCLPERLRAPVVLCYLQGLTYAEAAHQLGLSAVAIQGRLARARGRLRQRLIRRGVTAPIGLLAAGATSKAQAAIPLTLIHSTCRIAPGFMAGNMATVLARGVLSSMLVSQLRVATVLLCLGIGGSYWTWHALAGPADEKGQPDQGKGASTPASSPKPKATQPTATHRLTGSVRVEETDHLSKSTDPNASQITAAPAHGPNPDGSFSMMGRVLVEGTGEPVRDANVQVAVGGNSRDFVDSEYEFRTATSDGDGNFVVDLPRGTAHAWFLQPPAGYWTSSSIAPATFTVSPTRRVQRQDYTVRRGKVWTFSLTRGRDEWPVRSGTVIHNLVPGEAPSFFHIKVDEAGFAKATLPAEAGRATVLMQAGDLPGSEERVLLEWEEGFRPDAIKSVDKPPEGGPLARSRLTDVAGRLATVSGPVEPLVADGRLVLRIAFPEPDVKSFGSLSGSIVDEGGRPIAGAAVALIVREGHMTWLDRHRAYTDSQGRYLFRRVARRGPEGELRFRAVAKKPGSGGGTSHTFVSLAADDTPRVIEPIRLTPGVAIGGTVVDHEGQAVEGAWVEVLNFLDDQLVKTDSRGRFALRDVATRGIVPIVVQASGLSQQQRYIADGGSDPMIIRLPRPQAAGTKPGAIPTPSAPAGPAKQGQPAPPWQIAGWTDGKNRSLADYRGKVVFLDFWGIWCGPCVRELPGLESLKQKYESKGVIFLGIHSPGEGVAQVRKFLSLKGVSFPSGVDEGELNTYGTTVQRYGVAGFPTSILIDRDGVITFSSADPTFRKKLGAILEENRLKWETITVEQFGRMNEILLDREIEKLLGPR